jgi:heme-degrading monooxygenase HmoA
MQDYACVRVWQLRAGASAADLESLASSGFLEMQRWIPGVKQVALLNVTATPGQYVMVITFADHEAYMRWRRAEEEGADYWERYAAVASGWEDLASLVTEYAGALVMDEKLADRL